METEFEEADYFDDYFDVENDVENDYQYDVENDYQYDEEQFQNEYNVYDRCGYFDHNVLGNEQLGTCGKDLSVRDPTQRFTIYVDRLATDLMTRKLIRITKRDINFIVEKSKQVKEAKYKNPSGFVLGYYILNFDSQTIDKKLFTKLCKNLKDFPYTIRDYDIIRYANLWLKQKLL